MLLFESIGKLLIFKYRWKYKGKIDKFIGGFPLVPSPSHPVKYKDQTKTSPVYWWDFPLYFQLFRKIEDFCTISNEKPILIFNSLFNVYDFPIFLKISLQILEVFYQKLCLALSNIHCFYCTSSMTFQNVPKLYNTSVHIAIETSC